MKAVQKKHEERNTTELSAEDNFKRFTSGSGGGGGQRGHAPPPGPVKTSQKKEAAVRGRKFRLPPPLLYYLSCSGADPGGPWGPGPPKHQK